MDRFFSVGFLLIGVAAVVYSVSHAYVDISYLLINKADWEQTP